MNKKHSNPFLIKIKQNSSNSIILMKKIHFNKSAVFCYAFAIVAKSTISRGKLNKLAKANNSTPFNRAFFIRDFRTPQKSGVCRLFSMVGRNRHAFSVAGYPLRPVFHPVTPYRPNCGKFSGSSSKFSKGLSAMINSNQGTICLHSKKSSQTEFDTNYFHFKKCGQICYSSPAVAKSTAEPGNSNYLQLANSSTPFNRAFFVRSTRTPKERHKKACSSMVACSGKGSPFAVFQLSQFSSPLHVTAQTLESLAVTLQKSAIGVTQMYQFIFAAVRRTDLTNQIHKIRISATSELEARKALARDFVLVLAGRINLQNNAKTDRTLNLSPDMGVQYA